MDEGGSGQRFTKEERYLLVGVALFAAAALAWFVIRPWLAGGASARPDEPLRVVSVDKAPEVDEPRRDAPGKGGTVVLAPDAPLPLPGERIDAFLLVLAGDDDPALLALEGKDLFRPGATVADPERWLGRFLAAREDGVATYILKEGEVDGRHYRLRLDLDEATGEVRGFVLDADDPETPASQTPADVAK